MKKVKQISFDILVDENVDGCDFAEEVADFLEANGYKVLGAGFQEDMTDEYIEHYSELLEAENLMEDLLMERREQM